PRHHKCGKPQIQKKDRANAHNDLGRRDGGWTRQKMADAILIHKAESGLGERRGVSFVRDIARGLHGEGALRADQVVD
ncbi:MAG TPA: hypothetical protein VM785_10680, partial [Gaiellales bacterium]|nr:hypothetical protein [Gaiellales bacterium]